MLVRGSEQRSHSNPVQAADEKMLPNMVPIDPGLLAWSYNYSIGPWATSKSLQELYQTRTPDYSFDDINDVPCITLLFAHKAEWYRHIIYVIITTCCRARLAPAARRVSA